MSRGPGKNYFEVLRGQRTYLGSRGFDIKFFGARNEIFRIFLDLKFRSKDFYSFVVYKLQLSSQVQVQNFPSSVQPRVYLFNHPRLNLLLNIYH